ncbi:hypothetical protein A2U01_0085905, partial [Trifolium medium]|nr:hypothetical protein [Trifolium medium]
MDIEEDEEAPILI